MKKILIIDDEFDIRRLLKESLEMEGYTALTAGNAAEAIQNLSGEIDLILLDVNMPDRDGFSLCEIIREQVECPILFLTARIEERDKINGLKAGGDDYITKPFSMDELTARIEAHLRREERRLQKSRIYRSGLLTIDFDGKGAFYNGKNIGLTKTEFQIVELLLSHHGQTFEKERIYELVRGYEGEADAAIIMEHVRRIRKKLGKKDGKDYIETVWGVGYRWIG